MRAALANVISYPAYINLAYNRPYHFHIDGKKVIIILNALKKGVKITDTCNSLNFDGKGHLQYPITDFGRGLLLRGGMSDDETDVVDAEKKGEMNYLYGQLSMKDNGDIFVIEHYYSDLCIVIEFDNFSEEVYADQERRDRYNKIVYKALNHFITKYNIVNKKNFAHDTQVLYSFRSFENLGTESFVLRQNFFELEEGKTLEGFVTGDHSWHLKTESVVFEKPGINGRKGESQEYITKTTEAFEDSIENEVSAEQGFMSSALQELQKLNYRYAYLEAFLAIEAFVEKILDERKKGTGVPEKLLNDFSRETGIGYKINIEIPLALGSIDETHAGLIGALNKIRKTRNDIVHRGIAVSEEQVNEAIRVIWYYIYYVRQCIDAA